MQSENQELKHKYSSSKNQVEQLLNLNDKLKTHVGLLEGKINTSVSANVTSDSNDIQNHRGNQLKASKLSLGSDKPGDIQEYCYAELKQEGSCKKHKENKCRFVHEIPESVKQDKEGILAIIGENNLCINEFLGTGLCRQGENCRFHHKITDEQRSNPMIKEIMERKRRRVLQGKQGDTNIGRSKEICINEFSGTCRWGEKCHFCHEITEEQRNDPHLKEEIAKKSENLRMKRTQYPSQNLDKQTNDVSVPAELIKKLYEVLGAFKPADPAAISNHF